MYWDTPAHIVDLTSNYYWKGIFILDLKATYFVWKLFVRQLFFTICHFFFWQSAAVCLLIGRFVIIVTIFFKSILAPSGRGKTFRLGNTIFAISRKFWGLLRFLRETKVGEFRSSNTAILTHLRLWFVTVSSRKWRFPQIGGYYLVTHSHKWRLISRRLADFFVKLAYFLGNLRFGEIE